MKETEKLKCTLNKLIFNLGKANNSQVLKALENGVFI